MKRKKIILFSIIPLALIFFFVFGNTSSSIDGSIIIKAQEGEFIVDVITSGALEAKNSVKITGPINLRNYRIWNVTIQDIIDEGTYVKKGQYVAQLDPTELEGKIKDSQLEVEKQRSKYLQTKLDTALNMREARDNLVDLGYVVKEKQLVLDQSQYEPPATIQKAEIGLEKAKRSLLLAEENYSIKERLSIAKMQEVAANLRKETNQLEGLQELAKDFQIVAPEDGMLIYKKSWDDKPIKAGSQINAWDPTVATLPDLSKMLSRTYVNEVDIRKVKVGQKVEVGFDAFPDKRLTGQVIKVANVGEQRPNSDAKVFAVEIEVFGSDEVLKPGMTTSNRIITKTVENGLFVPLEALYTQSDSVTFVFRKSGLKTLKKEVRIGDANADNVLILEGLELNDEIYLSEPTGMEEVNVIALPRQSSAPVKAAR
ncbi:MAG: efflux RND transporter periplasmic adaptor subunit [Bacteroidota bacterium]